MNILVCVLTILFGMGSWIAVNGIFIELPILVNELPEDWSLPSYLVVVVQIANIGPIAYTIWNVLKPDKVYDKQLVFLMIFVGSIASLLLVFFWRETSDVRGEMHSTSLIALTFILSLVACTASVVFLAFMNTLKPVYMTPFFVGMGFSGLVPSLVALGQGAGQVRCKNMTLLNMTSNATSYFAQTVHQPPKFPVKYFFLFIFAMMIACGVAFTLLNYLPYCKSEHVLTIEKTKKRSESITKKLDEGMEELSNSSDNKEEENPRESMPLLTFGFYLILVGWINVLLNGVILSVQSYACLPYGIKYYHLAVTLSNIADPVAGFISFFLIIKSAVLISFVTFLGTVVSMYIVFLAASSPTPVFVGTTEGGILVVSFSLNNKRVHMFKNSKNNSAKVFKKFQNKFKQFKNVLSPMVITNKT